MSQYDLEILDMVSSRLPFGHEVGKVLAHNRHVLISIAGM